MLLAEAATDAGAGALLLFEEDLIAEARAAEIVKEMRVVVELEVGRNPEAVGAGHTVAAVGAGDHGAGAIKLTRPGNQREVPGRESARARLVGDAQIVIDLRGRAHAAEYNRDLGLIPQPGERPLDRRTMRGMALHRGQNILGRIGQPPAHQRLHDDHGQALGGRKLQPALARLILRVHVVVLNLAEGEQIAAVRDLLEGGVIVVEGEAEMTDAPVGESPLGPLEQSVLENRRVPALVTERVQQIEIDMAGLQLDELLVEQAIEVVRALDQPGWQLGGQADALAVAVAEGLAHDDFTLAAVIGVGRVEVVHAGIDRMAHHRDGLVFDDPRAHAISVGGGKAHAAKAQRRGLPIKLAEVSVLHYSPPRV